MVSNKTRVEPVPVLVPTTFPAGRGHYRLYLLLSCLSLRAHYSFPFTPPCTLTFSFFVPPLSSLALITRRSRSFETVRDFYDRDLCCTERKKSDASGQSERDETRVREASFKGNTNGRDDRRSNHRCCRASAITEPNTHAHARTIEYPRSLLKAF